MVMRCLQNDLVATKSPSGKKKNVLVVAKSLSGNFLKKTWRPLGFQAKK